MRVRISYTVEVNDEIRREIRRHYGQEGLANRDEVRSWYEAHGESMDQDLSMAADDFARSDDGRLEPCGCPTELVRDVGHQDGCNEA